MNYYHSFKDKNGKTLLSVIVAEVRRFSLEWSNNFILYMSLNESIDFYSNGQSSKMLPGDIVMINPNNPFSTLSDKRGCYCVAVVISPMIFADYKDSEHSIMFNITASAENRDSKEIRLLRSIVSRLMLYGISTKKYDIACFEGYMHLLAASLISHFYYVVPYQTTKQEINGLFTFETMIDYILRNHSEDITLDDVARVGNYNPNYVSQFFRQKAGVNFYDFLTRIRLRNATTRINNSELSLTEIAKISGFPSPKTLTRCFDQYYGISPSEYRNKIKSGEFSKLRTDIPYDRNGFIDNLARPFSPRIAAPITPAINALLLELSNSSDFSLGDIPGADNV